MKGCKVVMIDSCTLSNFIYRSNHDLEIIRLALSQATPLKGVRSWSLQRVPASWSPPPTSNARTCSMIGLRVGHDDGFRGRRSVRACRSTVVQLWPLRRIYRFERIPPWGQATRRHWYRSTHLVTRERLISTEVTWRLDSGSMGQPCSSSNMRSVLRIFWWV